jgi:DnaJ-class molecular chaperone
VGVFQLMKLEIDSDGKLKFDFTCDWCDGKGYDVHYIYARPDSPPIHTSVSQCPKCRGKGEIDRTQR